MELSAIDRLLCLKLTYLARKGSNTENQMELCKRVAVRKCLRIGSVVGVQLKEGRPMEHWKQRRPFLKEDVDHLVRQKTRRHFGRRISRNFGQARNGGSRSKEGLCVEVGI